MRRGWPLVVAGLASAVVVAGSAPGAATREGRIAFESFNGDDYDIYSIKPDGSRLVNLTRTPQFDEFEPSWSPDGREIAFTRVDAGGDATRIYVMNADGTRVRQVGRGGVWQQSPAWSPDGKRIAFSECVFRVEAGGDCSSAQIFVIGVDGRGTRRVTTPGHGWLVDAKPAWSPDGERLAFTRTPSFGINSIWTVGAGGRGARRLLTDGSTADHAPAWSPNGKELAYATDAGGPDALYIVRSDGTGRRRIAVAKSADVGAQGASLTNPVFAPSGERLAYMFGDDIWTMSPTGAGRRRLTSAGGDNPDWSH